MKAQVLSVSDEAPRGLPLRQLQRPLRCPPLPTIFWSSNALVTPPLQGLCTGCPLCSECSSPRYPYSSLKSLLKYCFTVSFSDPQIENCNPSSLAFLVFVYYSVFICKIYHPRKYCLPCLSPVVPLPGKLHEGRSFCPSVSCCMHVLCT